MPRNPILSVWLLVVCGAGWTVEAELNPPEPAEYAGLVLALGSAEPSQRDEARERLMMLSSDDLGPLSDAVRDVATSLRRPAWSQLHEIVRHVHVSGSHRFLPAEGRPLLGISNVTATFMDGEAAAPEPIFVGRPMIGLDAFRVVRSGDLLLMARTTRQDITPAQVRLDGFESFVQFVSQHRVGDVITVRVQRAGRLFEVSARLAARQNMVGQADVDRVQVNRLTASADAFWEQHFAPAAPPPLAAPRSGTSR